MEPVDAFGAVAVSLMVLFYALEQRAPGFILAFACACLLSSAYAIAIGAWPFAIVELIWSGVAAHRWHGNPFRRRTA